MVVFKCISCQYEHPRKSPPFVPPSQCERCGGGITMLNDTERPPAPAFTPEPPPSSEFKTELLRQGELKAGAERVFMSTIAYGLSRRIGPRDVPVELGKQVAALAAGGPLERDDFLPVASLLERATKLFDVALLIDAGGSNIAKARSRAAHAFLASGRDVWIFADEDVDASSQVLQALYEAVKDGAPSVCVAPCLLRDQGMANVAFEPVVVERQLPSGARVRSALFGGLGLCAVSREAILRMAPLMPDFIDDDGVEKKVFFDSCFIMRRPKVEGEGDADAVTYDWYGEDVAFFQFLPPGVRVEALMTGHTKHAGELLDLAQPYRPMPDRPSFTRRRKEATEHKFIDVGQVDAPPLSPAFQALLDQHEAAVKSEQAAPEVPALAATTEQQQAGEQQQTPADAAGGNPA